MRKLHPSYEMFVKEQQPKYKEPFTIWFAENKIKEEVDILQIMQRNNKYSLPINEFGFCENVHINYFKDFFTKKLQLCENMFQNFMNCQPTYDVDIAPNIADLYEDVIYEICTRDNVYVCWLPIIMYKNSPRKTDVFKFNNLESFKEEISSGISIVYFFNINDDFSIDVRYFKYEPLTRNVLVEK